MAQARQEACLDTRSQEPTPASLQRELCHLRFQSIPEALERWPRYCAPGYYRVEATIADRIWQPSLWGEDLRAAPVFEGSFPIATVEEMVLADIVAWPPDNPTVWWHRTNESSMLGRQHLVWALEDGKPLAIHATPLDWVKAGGDGVCILHADGVAELFGVRELRIADEMTAKRIYSDLKRLVPKIRVPEIRAA